MERSEIRGGIDASRQSRIALRSIRATTLTSSPPGLTRRSMLSARMFVAAPSIAGSSPAMTKYQTRHARPCAGHACCGNKSLRVKFVLCRLAMGGPANSMARIQEMPVFPSLTESLGAISLPLNSSLPSANRRSIPPNIRGRQPVTPTDGAGAVPAGGGSSLPLSGGPGIDPAGITTGARGASLKRDAKA